MGIERAAAMSSIPWERWSEHPALVDWFCGSNLRQQNRGIGTLYIRLVLIPDHKMAMLHVSLLTSFSASFLIFFLNPEMFDSAFMQFGEIAGGDALGSKVACYSHVSCELNLCMAFTLSTHWRKCFRPLCFDQLVRKRAFYCFIALFLFIIQSICVVSVFI